MAVAAAAVSTGSAVHSLAAPATAAPVIPAAVFAAIDMATLAYGDRPV